MTYEVGYSGLSLTADQIEPVMRAAIAGDPDILISGHSIRTGVKSVALAYANGCRAHGAETTIETL